MDSVSRQRFFQAMARFKKTESVFASECEIPMNELAILQSITGDCECSECSCVNLNMPDIQEKLRITKPAVSYILNTLEKKNYINREIDPKDRRKITIRATPEGLAAVEECTRKCDEMWDQVISQFGEENMLKLLALLNDLYDTFEELNPRG